MRKCASTEKYRLILTEFQEPFSMVCVFIYFVNVFSELATRGTMYSSIILIEELNIWRPSYNKGDFQIPISPPADPHHQQTKDLGMKSLPWHVRGSGVNWRGGGDSCCFCLIVFPSLGHVALCGSWGWGTWWPPRLHVWIRVCILKETTCNPPLLYQALILDIYCIYFFWVCFFAMEHLPTPLLSYPCYFFHHNLVNRLDKCKNKLQIQLLH